jgi:hypothetical protein
MFQGVCPDGPTEPRVRRPRKKEGHTVVVRWGPHLSFLWGSAWECVRPLDRRGCIWHGAHGSVRGHSLSMECMQRVGARAWVVTTRCSEFVRGGVPASTCAALMTIDRWQLSAGPYVANVYSKYFICFRRMLQVFYVNVAHVAVAIHICCKRMLQMFHLFQTHVAEVLHVATLADEAGACGGSPRRRSSPHVRDK